MPPGDATAESGETTDPAVPDAGTADPPPQQLRPEDVLEFEEARDGTLRTRAPI